MHNLKVGEYFEHKSDIIMMNIQNKAKHKPKQN